MRIRGHSRGLRITIGTRLLSLTTRCRPIWVSQAQGEFMTDTIGAHGYHLCMFGLYHCLVSFAL